MANQLELNPGGPALAAAIAFIVVGLAIKLALFPVHGWLPDVYTYAPTPVIGFVAAVMTKVSAYALFRILYFVLNGHGITTKALEALGWIAALGILAGSLMALVQKDIRRVLAYSSISQLGYIVLGFAIGNTWALTGALLHVINHAVIKSCLFLTVGACQWKTGATRVAEYSGLGRRLPITIGALTVSAIAIVGLPPTAGFFSKWYLAVGILQAGNWPFLIILILSSLISAVYFYRVIEQAYFGPVDTAYLQNQTSGKLELPVAMLSPIVLLAVATVLLGLFNQQIVTSVITKALPILP
jgi:multicomponent Na+:H+ antiporter subunit D